MVRVYGWEEGERVLLMMMELWNWAPGKRKSNRRIEDSVRV